MILTAPQQYMDLPRLRQLRSMITLEMQKRSEAFLILRLLTLQEQLKLEMVPRFRLGFVAEPRSGREQKTFGTTLRLQSLVPSLLTRLEQITIPILRYGQVQTLAALPWL